MAGNPELVKVSPKHSRREFLKLVGVAGLEVVGGLVLVSCGYAAPRYTIYTNAHENARIKIPEDFKDVPVTNIRWRWNYNSNEDIWRADSADLKYINIFKSSTNNLRVLTTREYSALPDNREWRAFAMGSRSQIFNILRIDHNYAAQLLGISLLAPEDYNNEAFEIVLQADRGLDVKEETELGLKMYLQQVETQSFEPLKDSFRIFSIIS